MRRHCPIESVWLSLVLVLLVSGCVGQRSYRVVEISLSEYPEMLSNEHCPQGWRVGCYHWGYFDEWRVNCRQELPGERPGYKGCSISPRKRPDPEPWGGTSFPDFGLSIPSTDHWWVKISTHYYHESRPALLIEVRDGVYRTLRSHGSKYKDWENRKALRDIDKILEAKSIRMVYRDESGKESHKDFSLAGFSEAWMTIVDFMAFDGQIYE